MVKNYGLNGLDQDIELGKNGIRIISDGSLLKARNNADDAYVKIQADAATADNDVVIKSQLDAKQNTLSVAAASAGYLDITNDEISVKNLLITDVTVDVTYTTIALFAATEYSGTEYQKGDVVILTAATDQQQRTWIHNGGTAGTEADFTRLQTDLNETVIKAMFSASSGITYNPATGEFTLDTINATDIVTTNTGYTIISGLTAQALFDDIVDKIENTVVPKVIAVETLNGMPSGSTDLGTFTGTTIADNSTIKTALQSLETAVENVGDKCRKVPFSYTDTGGLNIGAVIPSGNYIKEISVKVTTAFNDIAATLAIGTSGDPDLLMTTAQNDLQDLGIYAETVFEVLGSDTQFIATIVPGTSTQGAGYILIEYC